jgi:hypothetical protein
MVAVAVIALDIGAIRAVDPAEPRNAVLGFGILPRRSVAVGVPRRVCSSFARLGLRRIII